MDLNKTFYHQTVTTKQVENYISQQAGFDYSKVFDQYLRTTQIPTFEYYLSKNKKEATYHYTNCVASFNLPLVIKDSTGATIKLLPTTQWKTTPVTQQQISLFTKEAIEKMYYINVEEKPKE